MRLDRADVEEMLASGRRTEFSGLDLTGLDLTGLDLDGAILYGTDLYRANLAGANLTGAILYGADLAGAILHRANLTGANLHRANLTGANLYGADLHRAIWDGLSMTGLPSGAAYLIPTPAGWKTRIGCWEGTITQLRDMIAGTDWPEATGDEQTRRRPGLAAWCDMCDAHTDAHPDTITKLQARWTRWRFLKSS